MVQGRRGGDPAPQAWIRACPAPGAETVEQKLTRLQAEVCELRAEKTKLATERDILRSAAKYFAGETNW